MFWSFFVLTTSLLCVFGAPPSPPQFPSSEAGAGNVAFIPTPESPPSETPPALEPEPPSSPSPEPPSPSPEPPSSPSPEPEPPAPAVQERSPFVVQEPSSVSGQEPQPASQQNPTIQEHQPASQQNPSVQEPQPASQQTPAVQETQHAPISPQVTDGFHSVRVVEPQIVLSPEVPSPESIKVAPSTLSTPSVPSAPESVKVEPSAPVPKTPLPPIPSPDLSPDPSPGPAPDSSSNPSAEVGEATKEQSEPDAATNQKQPHIIFFMTDDMGYHDVGYHGSEFPTENIDKLANEGIKLENYYSQHLCSPSRVAFMTGRHPVELASQNGIFAYLSTPGLPKGPTLGNHLQDLGYLTHLVGKWHLGYSTFDDFPDERGFDSFFGYVGSEVEYFTHDVIPSLSAHIRCGQESFDLNGQLEMGFDLYSNKEPVAELYQGSYSTELFTEKTIEIIQQHHVGEEAQPLFIFVSYQAPHDPWQAPNRLTFGSACRHIEDQHRQIYCGMIQSIDDGIGAVVETLEESGYLENTLIIFSSDNGAVTTEDSPDEPAAGSNSPFRGGKATLFEGSVRVPAFIWGNPVKPLTFRYSSSGFSPDSTEESAVFHSLFQMPDWFLTIQAAASDRRGCDNFGNCLNQHDGIGCNNAEVEECVCGIDHYCCTVRYDQVCADMAYDCGCGDGFVDRVLLTKEVDGVQLISSYNQWEPLKFSEAGHRDIMLYNLLWPVDSFNGAIRNLEYKLYYGTDRISHDGWFDASNRTKEQILCQQNCLNNPPRLFFHISEDPEERAPLDINSLSRLEMQNFDELSYSLQRWSYVVEEPEDSALDASALPRFWNCYHHPWISTENNPLPANITCKTGEQRICREIPSDINSWRKYAVEPS